jgi:stage V sporulation protein R
MEEQKRKMERERDRPKKNPEEPERDVLMFLLQNAPLDPWERDILEIVRDEAYYFAPQRQTKILNEGWASYWHSRIMTERALNVSEIIDYADHNAGVLATAPGQFNPYKIGIELLRDIEERWDKGRFGREWDECQSLDQRRVWDKRVGLGRKKIFEVRKLHNDVTFIDEFFTADFCERNRFFSFSLNDRSGNYEIDSREFDKIKHKMLFSLTNFGDPFIFVEDSNHDNRGELLMRHRHEGTDLQIDHARATLTSLVRIWRRPVSLLTVVEGKQKLFRYDGKEQVEKSLGN